MSVGTSPIPEVLLLGGGPMGRAYAAVLADMKAPFTALTRTEKSAQAFTADFGVACRAGDAAEMLASYDRIPDYVIVAMPVADLARVASAVLKMGCKNVLVEKPGGVTPEQVRALAEVARAANSNVWVAYNRRFYESVRQAQQLIEQDGGLVSFRFEFTELSDRVGQIELPAEVMENWALANSTHVIDTAFFIGGSPARIDGIRQGGFSWHPSGARYAGHGATGQGVPFVYFADWDAPGRWGIEFNTRNRKLILQPMESLQVQTRGSFSAASVPLDDRLDRTYKPGIHRQTAAFLSGAEKDRLIDIARHSTNMQLIRDRILLAPQVDRTGPDAKALSPAW